MFEKLRPYWRDRGMEFLVIGAIIVIVVTFLLRRGSKGTYEILDASSWLSPQVKTSVNSLDFEQKHKIAESKGELECRRILQDLFNVPFPKCRPNILKNPVTVNYNLEIDCYNDEMKLGLEYNGKQHYEYTPFFHRNFETFRNQQYRDELKRRICRENGIFLIEVPYTIKLENMKGFILEELQKIKNVING